MKIDFAQKIVDLSGKTMEKESGKDATLSNICVEALLLSREEDKNLPVVDKLKRGKLAEKIYLQDETPDVIINLTTVIDITVEEANLLQALVGKTYSPLVVLRVYTMLEGEK